MFERENLSPARPVWEVGALCRAVADALAARFSAVTVRGEITGFVRAASGHCYFAIKDAQGQLRCAMFKRAASGLNFVPRDGELVQLQGRLDVYPQRGELQLIVERLERAGQGALFEQFLRLKALLEAEGLFDAARKRSLAAQPRGIGVVTSLGAAALHDVVTALQRRVPHIPVLLVPAQVQGAQAPASLCQALSKLYQLAQSGQALEGQNTTIPAIDVILLVRGGGSMEDLWAFNDEQLARTIVQSPVPLLCGVGHETDFTIADFCADLRAPTPTAAAELAAAPRADWLGALQWQQERLQQALQRQLDARSQRLDMAAQRLGRPSSLLARQALQCQRQGQRLRHAVLLKLQLLAQAQQALEAQMPPIWQRSLQQRSEQLQRLALRLDLLAPQRVLERGYALLSDDQGQSVTRCAQVRSGAPLRAQLADGTLDLTVAPPRLL